MTSGDGEQANLVAQVFSSIFFAGVGIWLVLQNSSKLTYLQKSSLEKRLGACAFITSYIACFSSFFNFLQLTEVDDVTLPGTDNVVVEFARPVEWICTCPLMQLILVLLGGTKLPENRLIIMPLLSVIVLAFGASTLFVSQTFRIVLYFFGVIFCGLMFFLNQQHIVTNSGRKESFFYGDSAFRKATVILVLTWFPFPIWFLLSPEGFNLITNILFVKCGWSFLNILSKFAFIFYIQRIKDDYFNRLRAKRECQPDSYFNVGSGAMKMSDVNENSTSELHSVVMETMCFLGMAHNSDRLCRLFLHAGINTPDMVLQLTQDQCRRDQLPWELICAIQRRINIWRMEMTDEAELSIENGERHFNVGSSSDAFGPFMVHSGGGWMNNEGCKELLEQMIQTTMDSCSRMEERVSQGMMQSPDSPRAIQDLLAYERLERALHEGLYQVHAKTERQDIMIQNLKANLQQNVREKIARIQASSGNGGEKVEKVLRGLIATATESSETLQKQLKIHEQLQSRQATDFETAFLDKFERVESLVQMQQAEGSVHGDGDLPLDMDAALDSIIQEQATTRAKLEDNTALNRMELEENVSSCVERSFKKMDKEMVGMKLVVKTELSRIREAVEAEHEKQQPGMPR